jgi:pyruvate/2-oxoglutarate dehydrogenase complex dihydrolipoamide acyltransferase (E2) component
VTFDHDIVDGGPATRFTRRLVELIESGYGLIEEDIHAEKATTRQDR